VRATSATEQEMEAEDRGTRRRIGDRARLWSGGGQKTGQLVGGILFAIAALAMSFGGFLTFIWAAVGLTLEESRWPEGFKSGWLIPLVLELVALAISVFLLRNSRNPSLVGMGAISLGLTVFLVVISPYF
jgi:hypothetical protein